MSRIPKSRRNEIKSIVLKLLSNPEHAVLPVPVKKIAKSIPNCRLLSFSEMARQDNVSIKEFISKVGCDDAYTDYLAFNGMYFICYNDSSPELNKSYRYRWNIAHEIGHVVLKHNVMFKKARLLRRDLSDAEYDLIESEADLFAKYLLIPFAPLKVIGINDSKDFRRYCKISNQSAEIAYSDYTEWYEERFKNQYDHMLARSFIKSFYCTNCGHIGTLGHSQFICPVCGKKKSISYYYLKGDEQMKYTPIRLNDKFKTVKCPICGNEETDIVGDYCQICGAMIVNRCASGNHFGPDYCPGTEGLEGNARFCPYCGHPSTFNQNKILKPWKEVIDDLDLPFPPYF